MKNKDAYLLVLALVLSSIILYFVLRNDHSKDEVPFLGDTTIRIPLTKDRLPADKNVLLSQLGKQITSLMRDSNYAGLAPYFYPGKGVRLSPYTYIDTATDLQLNAQEFLNVLNQNQKMIWGTEDPTGDTLSLTVREYFKHYVYDVDFMKAPEVEINHFIGFSTTLNNIKNIYPNSDFIEYYFPGFEKKYGGIDWRSLRLIFSLYKGKYYLVGIVHDQWTT